jgi:hypothetical protein
MDEARASFVEVYFVHHSSPQWLARWWAAAATGCGRSHSNRSSGQALWCCRASGKQYLTLGNITRYMFKAMGKPPLPGRPPTKINLNCCPCAVAFDALQHACPTDKHSCGASCASATVTARAATSSWTFPGF